MSQDMGLGAQARKGFCHVYTGNGKGKTTAALGLAMRALGHGWKVLVLQFMKGNINYGELQAAGRLQPELVVEQGGRETFVDPQNPDPMDVELARKTLDKSRAALAAGDYDLVVLDEVCVAVKFGLVSVDDVLEAVRGRAGHVEVVLTGRWAHERLIEEADLVTEMKQVKHYYDDKGIEAREGIEF